MELNPYLIGTVNSNLLIATFVDKTLEKKLKIKPAYIQ